MEDKNYELEGKAIATVQTITQREKNTSVNHGTSSSLTIRICATGVLKGKKWGAEKLSEEIIDENFPNLVQISQ